MSYYQEQLLTQVSEQDVEAWLTNNPVPSTWQGDKWSYAFWYMERQFNED